MSRPGLRSLLAAALLLAALAGAGAAVGASGAARSAARATLRAWPEFGLDPQRSDATALATGITAANFGHLKGRTIALPGTVDSSPIYLHGAAGRRVRPRHRVRDDRLRHHVRARRRQRQDPLDLRPARPSHVARQRSDHDRDARSLTPVIATCTRPRPTGSSTSSRSRTAARRPAGRCASRRLPSARS